MEEKTPNPYYSEPIWFDLQSDTLAEFYFVCYIKFSCRATEHGKKYASVAVELYAKDYGCMYGTSEKCGLFIYYQYPLLAASPNMFTGKNIPLV